MILKSFDQGWGREWPTKALETELLDRYLSPIKHDQTPTIMVNSTWYNHELHATVCDYAKHHGIQHVILISMLDHAIVDASWFDDLKITVSSIGYYRGKNHLDFWAMAVDKWFDRPSQFGFHAIDTPYMCLNRKPHWHRVKLYHDLGQAGLLHHGLVSLGGDHGQAVRTLLHDNISNNLAPNPGTDGHGIANDIMSLGNASNWQRCFLQVVTETVFDIEKMYFVSEKIYKPMLAMRPFVVYASDGARHWLAERGFLDYLDDFGDICDLDLSQPNNIVPFLAQLCQQPSSYWQEKIKKLMAKLNHNRQRFHAYCVEQQYQVSRGICLE